MAAHCDVTGNRSLCTEQVPPDQVGRSWSAQGLHNSNTTTPELENQPESFNLDINEVLSLTLMDDSFAKLARQH